MLKYIGKRLLTAIPVLIFISLGAFLMLQLAPGDPADLYITPDTTQQQIEATREALGLNQPIFVQYFRWLSQVLRGNLGYSFTNSQPVLEVIGERLFPTVLLMGVSLIVAYLIGIPLGIISARNNGNWKDTLITSLTYLGISIPAFFFGLSLVYIFGVRLGWFPTGGMYPLGTQPTWGIIAQHMVLPVIVMSSSYLASMTRYMRSTTIDVYHQNYIRTAVAKGLNSGEVFSRHAIRNSLIPIITVIGTDLPRLVGGSIVVEQVFSWPGLGSLTMTAIQQRNYPIILGITMLSAVVVLTANLIVDILYAVIDPRINYD
jgi:peptide/nickel transport system permease protein